MDTYEQKRKEVVDFLIDEENENRLPQYKISSEDELDFDVRRHLEIIDSIKDDADFVVNNPKDAMRDYYIKNIKDHIKEYESSLESYKRDGYSAEVQEYKMFLDLLKEGTKNVIGLDMKESLKESLEDGISATFRELLNQENTLLSQYESAQVTLEDNGETRFNEVLDYIKDDINIHIGMLQAAIEDVNPSAEKIDDGKEQAETMMLDESLFESNDSALLYAYLIHSTMTDTTFALISDEKQKLSADIRKKFRDFIIGESDDDNFESEFSEFTNEGFLLGHDDDAREPWQNIFYADEIEAEEQDLPHAGWYLDGGQQLEIVGTYTERF